MCPRPRPRWFASRAGPQPQGVQLTFACPGRTSWPNGQRRGRWSNICTGTRWSCPRRPRRNPPACPVLRSSRTARSWRQTGYRPSRGVRTIAVLPRPAASYRELAVLAGRVGARVILDGEIVALRAGRPDFGALQSRMHVRRPPSRLIDGTSAQLYLFDLLHHGQDSLLGPPYTERRDRLEELGPAVRPAGLAPPLPPNRYRQRGHRPRRHWRHRPRRHRAAGRKHPGRRPCGRGRPWSAPSSKKPSFNTLRVGAPPAQMSAV